MCDGLKRDGEITHIRLNWVRKRSKNVIGHVCKHPCSTLELPLNKSSAGPLHVATLENAKDVPSICLSALFISRQGSVSASRDPPIAFLCHTFSVTSMTFWPLLCLLSLISLPTLVVVPFKQNLFNSFISFLLLFGQQPPKGR